MVFVPHTVNTEFYEDCSINGCNTDNSISLPQSDHFVMIITQKCNTNSVNALRVSDSPEINLIKKSKFFELKYCDFFTTTNETKRKVTSSLWKHHGAVELWTFRYRQISGVNNPMKQLLIHCREALWLVVQSKIFC
jgi:hypothetical protein